MSDLYPCVACKRHIRTDESACPFCRAAVGEDFAARAIPRTVIGRPLTRAALLFAGAAAIAACSSGSGTTTSGGSASGEPAYGGPPIEEDSGKPTDAASDGTPKFDGPVALYGPAPVDAGDG